MLFLVLWGFALFPIIIIIIIIIIISVVDDIWLMKLRGKSVRS